MLESISWHVSTATGFDEWDFSLTPLLVLDLLYRIIPGVPCIVDNDMDLTAAKFRRLLNEVINSCIIRDVSGYCKPGASF